MIANTQGKCFKFTSILFPSFQNGSDCLTGLEIYCI